MPAALVLRVLVLAAAARAAVLDARTACDRAALTATLRLDRPFKGVVFSKDFSRECRAAGNLSDTVSIQLPSNACGVRTSTLNGSDALYYSVDLVLQMDRQLQQSTDYEVAVRCKLDPKATRISSVALDGVVQAKLREMAQDTKKTRTGRTRQGWSQPEQRQSLLESARAWMQLAPAGGGAEPATVEVGQPTKLLIQSSLPVGVGLRVTNCLAHDGLGEASQKLLDDAGCPVDDTIFTQPTIHKQHRNTEIDFSAPYPSGLMTYRHAVTTFAAFKFPDRARLHLTCGLELCKGDCPPVDCKALSRPYQRDGLLRKARLDKDAKGVVIDRLEVYNSIEVLAPNIELDDEASIRGSRRIDGEEDLIRGFSPGDKTICLSPGKMALAFCILGVIFLCAIAVAFVSLVRARRRMGRENMNTSLSFYTGSKSMFSSSESSSSGLSGSKLLLTDSPYLDQHSSSSNNWPYSRGFEPVRSL